MNIIKLLIPKCFIAYLESHNTLRQGLEKMRSHGYTAIPVITKEGVYVGTIREGDFLWNIIDRDETEMKSLEKIPIKDLIHRDFNPPVHISSSMKELLERAKNQNFVPVVDDRGFFVGIITRKDIITYFCDNYLEDSEQDK